MSGPLQVKWLTDDFLRKMKEVDRRTQRASERVVLDSGRQLINAATYRCPIKTGRARAGFWPAAIAFKMRTVRSPYKGPREGSAKSDLKSTNPYVMFTNAVPYITHMGVVRASAGQEGRMYRLTYGTRKQKREAGYVGHGLQWWYDSVAAAMKSMQRTLDKEIKKALAV